MTFADTDLGGVPLSWAITCNIFLIDFLPLPNLYVCEEAVGLGMNIIWAKGDLATSPSKNKGKCPEKVW